MKRLHLLISIVFCVVNNYNCLAQNTNYCSTNLIQNPGFEIPTATCGTVADIQLYENQTPVQAWYGTEMYNTIVGSSPDYFSPCAGTTNSANTACLSGSGRVGVFTHTSFSNGREHVQAQLTQGLVAGKTYFFSMVVKSRVGSAGNLLSSCDGIGAWFHNNGLIDLQSMNGGQQHIGPGSIINASPQIENPSGNLIGAQCVTVSGTFCAQGGESWVVLGNFRDDANTQIVGSNPSNYMYIDDVALYEVCYDINLTASDSSLFCGQSSSLTASITGFGANTIYNWYTPSISNLSGLGPHVVSPNATTTYMVIASESGICPLPILDTAFITVDVNCGLSFELSDTSICIGECYNLQPSAPIGGIPPYSYSWSPNIGTSSGPYTVCPLTTTIYYLTVTDSAGASYTDSAIVTVNTMPIVNAGLDDSLCVGTSIQLSGTINIGNPTWLNGPNSLNYIVSPTNTTTYYFQSNNNGCIATDSVLISVFNNPIINLIHNNVTCNGLNNGSATVNVISGAAPFQYTWNPIGLATATVNNLSPQTYTLSVIDNVGCFIVDTFDITEPLPLTGFITGDDSVCAGETINLAATASGGNGMYNYLWLNNASTANPYVTSLNSNQLINVQVADQNGCLDTAGIMIYVASKPIADFSGNYQGCLSVTATFTNLSVGATSYQWNFGDNSTSTLVAPTHVYSSVGCHNVTLYVNNNFGCKDTASSICAVNVFPLPIADIYTTNDFVYEGAPTISIINSSTGADNCSLSFGDGTLSNLCLSNYEHSYPSVGTYTITQIVSNNYGCSDTTTILIEVKPETTIWVPNAFTPSGNDLNDVFLAKGVQVEEFNMKIFNRWGELLFESNDINTGWDGTSHGETVMQDVYVWTIQYKDIKKGTQIMRGHVTVVK